MKKSLSLLVAIAMVFSMFASVAFAAEATAELTTQQKFDALKAAGVFTGYPDGTAGLTNEMTRAEFAKVLAKINMLEDNAAAAKIYSDVSASHWAVGQIGSVTKAGFMTGIGAGKFGPTGKVTLEQVAKVATLIAGISQVDKAVAGKVSPWAKGYVAAAIEAGLLPEVPSYQANATRGILVDVAFDLYQAGTVAVKDVKIVDSKNIEVTFTDGGVVKQALDTALEVDKEVTVSVVYNSKTYAVKVKLTGAEVTKAAATGAKKVTVTFASAVDTAKVTFAVKQGTTVANVTKTTWNDAKTEAVLETSVALSTGDYTVTASGVTFATGKNVATFSVTPERIETVWVDDNAYRTAPAATTVEVAVKLLNQYGEEVSAGVAGTVYATSSVGVPTSPINLADKKVVITGVSDTTTALSITVVDAKFAKSTSKQVTVLAFKSIGEVVLGTPELPTGKTALEANMTAIALPYTAKDQYGNATTLAPADLTGKLTFVISDTAAINTIGLTSDNKKLTFNTGNFNGPKNVSVLVIVNATGKSSKIDIALVGKKSINTVALVSPSSQLAVDSSVKVELTGTDQYGNALTGQEIADRAAAELVITSGNPAAFTVGTVTVSDGKAYVGLNGVGKGTAVVIVTVKANGNNANIPLTVVDAKYTQTITPTTSVTRAVYVDAVNAAAITIKADFTDQYGGAYNDSALTSVEVKVDNASFGAAPANQSPTALHNTGVTFTAKEAGKTTVVTFNLYNGATIVDTKTVTLTSVAKDAALTYEVEALGTLATNADVAYAKTVKVIAKDASGNVVALPATAIQQVVSGDTAALTVTGNVIKAIGTADVDTNVNVQVAKPNGDVITLVAPVKVSKAAPAPVSLTAKKGDDASAAKVEVTGPITLNLTANNGTLWFETKDQYGTTALSNDATFYVYNESTGLNKIANPASVNFAVGTYKITVSIGDKTAAVELTVK